MASLQQQLKKLGTADLRNVSEVSRKFKASFLFSAREAADQDIDTIYSIAYNGIMELTILDPKFHAFERTLFSEEMKSVDRILQSKEDNDKLDTSIKSFMQHLSPYFLLKPAGKVLEYLIRHFRINEFNVPDILACIFPYHETKSFVKMVSILTIEANSSFSVLHSVQKSGVPLERSFLVARMERRKHLLNFICNTVLQCPVPFPTLYSFYAATMTELVSKHGLNEESVLTITANLVDGLSASKVPDLQIASYMILSQLATKVSLTKEAIQTMTTTAIKHTSSDYFKFCLLTVVHVAQSQANFTELAKSSTKRLLKAPGFDKSFMEIARKYTLDKLFAVLAAAICKASKVGLLVDLVHQALISKENVGLLCEHAIDGYIKLVASGSTPEQKADYTHQFQPLLAIISQCYVDELDAVLTSKLGIYADVSEDKKVQAKALYEFVAIAFKGTRHEVIEEANTTLYLCLNSPSTSTRLLALKKLISVIEDETNLLVQSPDLIQSALAACLNSFDATLLYALCDVPYQLIKHVPCADILSALSNLLQEQDASNKEESIAVMNFLLGPLIERHPEEETNIASLLVAFVFVAPMEHIQHLVKSMPTMAKKNTVLCNLMQDIKTLVKQPTFSVTEFIQLEADTLCTNKKEQSVKFWIEMLQNKGALQHSVGLLVLNRGLVLTKGEAQYILASKSLSAMMNSLNEDQKQALYTVNLSQGLLVNEEGLPQAYALEQLKCEQLTSEFQINLIQSTLSTFASSLECKQVVSWCVEEKDASTESYRQIVTYLFKIFVGGTKLGCFEEMLGRIISKQLKEGVLNFLMSVWCQTENMFLVNTRTLQLAAVYIRQHSLEPRVDFQHVVPALLPCLTDESKSVRLGALSCLESIEALYTVLQLPSGSKIYTPNTGVSEPAKPLPAGSLSVLSAQSVYNIIATFPDLRTNDAAHFVDYLLHRKDELKQDKSAIITVLIDCVQLCHTSSQKQQKTRKNSIIDLLLNHVLYAPCIEIQVKILSLLDKVESPRKLQHLFPLLESTLNAPRTAKSTTFVSLLIRCYSHLNAYALGAKGDKTLSLFLRLLSNCDTLQGEDEDGWQLSTRQLALGQISRDFFKYANEASQKSILETLLDIATNGQQNEVKTVKKVLVEIPIAANMLRDVLVRFTKSISSISLEATIAPSTGKRARMTEPEPKKSVDLYELVTVLELIESKTIVEDVVLVKPLFEVLTAMVNADLHDSPVSLEYINQLLMSALTRIVQSAEESKAHVEESILRVDVVVQCIRVTGNPQTHNQALLLMATIASMYPERVLHNIMPVFTFMGANVLRQDDNYSFQVIQQTLEKILPPLVSSSRLASDNEAALALQVKPIIKVFVDALFHIPKHRRLRLFTVLIHTLGEDEFLYAIISLLLDKFIEKLAKGARAEAESLTEFSLTISQQFSPQTQMKAILSLLKGLLTLPNEKSEDDTMNENTLFNSNEHNGKQLRQYKLATLTFIGQLLSSRSFLAKIMTQSNASEDFEEKMQPYYLATVEHILMIVTYFTEYRDQYAVSEGANPSITKFWRGILKVVYDDLAKVNALLALPAFVNVVSHLIQHPEVTIRRKAMDMFYERIQAHNNQTSVEEETLLVGMVEKFSQVITKETSIAGEEDSLINKQSALLCMSTLASMFGSIYPERFSTAIPVVIGEDCLLLTKPQIKISSLVYISVICQEIGPRAMPYLPKFMPLVLDIFSMTVEAEHPNAMLQLSVISTLEMIVKVLPHFISSYLPKLLSSLLHSSIYTTNETNDTQKLLAKEKVLAVISEIATNVPARTLFTPVFASYEKALKNGKDSVLALFKLMSEAVQTISRDAMTAHYKQLFKFFLIAFDIRRLQSSVFDNDTINEIESAAISTFLVMVMKLNETLFKPLFLKIVDWATVELTIGSDTATPGLQQRALFFYKLVDGLLEKLKSIFVPYFSYVIDDTIGRLNNYCSQENNEQPDTLWNCIMSALQKSFLYDNDNLWNAERFDKILDPVLDQMLVVSKGDAQDYLSRMVTYLVPCIGQMAVTVSNDTLWKPLNHKVLMKTREDIPEIRLAALHCIEEFYSRLGEEWLLFLAESISFLAELMEDDDDRVEKRVQLVNAQIETHLGESLDKFFN
ncbi:hypothetical protein BDF14DRAFT_1985180 [Spinellus fusiger]|nr:hypothetical protein BDF14DRAFT_1985180 [Spinellus fusiger]